MTIASRSLAPLVTRRAQARLGIALVIPVMVMTVLFFLFPMVNALYYSVVDFNGVNPNPPFIGLDNFTKMFTDSKMWHALGNNVIWIIVGTISPMVIGILVAMLLWSVRRGSVIYRVIFFLPYVLPGVAIGIVWGWIYDPVNGLLNQML
jgi:ABC-type sugar transport system permease subunit